MKSAACQEIFSRRTSGEGLADTGLIFAPFHTLEMEGFPGKKETGGVRTPQIHLLLSSPCFQTGTLAQVKDADSYFSTFFLFFKDAIL